MTIRFRPRGPMPAPDLTQITSLFKATWSDTLALLDYEAARLNDGRDTLVTIAVDLPERAFRLDGGLRADHPHPTSTGVVVSFDSRHGALTYRSDQYNAGYSWQTRYLTGWQANVRAVALGLEALRAIDRYGISHTGEQYRGFAALPASSGVNMTYDNAIGLIATLAGWTNSMVRDNPARGYRLARKAAHPDADGGSADQFRLVEGAWQIIRRTIVDIEKC